MHMPSAIKKRTIRLLAERHCKVTSSEGRALRNIDYLAAQSAFRLLEQFLEKFGKEEWIQDYWPEQDDDAKALGVPHERKPNTLWD